MAPRGTMADLIGRVRTLIADAGTSPQFSDQQIQDALDERRVEHRWVPLRPVATLSPGAGVQYHDFYADAQNWEGDVQLQDTSFATITPDVAELLPGHWSFATQPNGYAVRATGKTFDLYGSAADLLERWAASVKLDFNFSDGSSQFARMQKFQMITALAADYRARALPQTGRITQSEVMPDHIGGGVVYPSYGADGTGW